MQQIAYGAGPWLNFTLIINKKVLMRVRKEPKRACQGMNAISQMLS